MRSPTPHPRVRVPRILRFGGSAVAAPSAAVPAARVDAGYALSRAEAERLARHLGGRSHVHETGPATPARLRGAVERALGPALDGGSVEVVRLPGALHSPESWHVRLVGVPVALRDHLEAAVRASRGAGTADAR